MRSMVAAAHSEAKARRPSTVMWIAPAGGGAGSSGESSEGCFGAFLARWVRRLCGLSAGAPVAAGGAGGATAARGREADDGAAVRCWRRRR
jgi:hypothetical protein